MIRECDNPQFRLAVESDADAILEFMRAYYALDGHGFDPAKARGALIGLLRDLNLGRVWIILDADRLDGDAAVGYVVLCFGYSLEWLGRDAFVDEFYLREEYRGRGWGRATRGFWRRRRGMLALSRCIWKLCRRTIRLWSFTRSWAFRSTRARFCRSGLRGVLRSRRGDTDIEELGGFAMTTRVPRYVSPGGSSDMLSPLHPVDFHSAPRADGAMD